jgi:hypothetical protein
MDPTNILLPLAAQVALTFGVLLMIPLYRVRAVRAGRVVVADFKLGESPNVPADVSIPNRNFMNLLEMPVLFYLVCVVLYVTKRVDTAALLLTWLYVALRAGHTLVHLTYNNVLHRLGAFAASNVVLAITWMRLFAALLR